MYTLHHKEQLSTKYHSQSEKLDPPNPLVSWAAEQSAQKEASVGVAMFYASLDLDLLDTDTQT